MIKLKQIAVIFTVVISVAAFSCSNTGEEESIISFEVIHGGTSTAVTEKKQVVATNNDDYQKLMNEVYANLDQMPRIPDVDFSKNDVVAVFMGAKSTGGYSIKVDKVIKRTDAVTVAVNEISPGPKCAVTQMITQPYEIIKVPKLNQKVKYIFKQKVDECN